MEKFIMKNTKKNNTPEYMQILKHFAVVIFIMLCSQSLIASYPQHWFIIGFLSTMLILQYCHVLDKYYKDIDEAQRQKAERIINKIKNIIISILTAFKNIAENIIILIIGRKNFNIINRFILHNPISALLRLVYKCFKN